jgi:hypothetical protein
MLLVHGDKDSEVCIPDKPREPTQRAGRCSADVGSVDSMGATIDIIRPGSITVSGGRYNSAPHLDRNTNPQNLS